MIAATGLQVTDARASSQPRPAMTQSAPTIAQNVLPVIEDPWMS